ncbi:transcription elongation factor GreB [Niveibacterium sp. SC-1]|uniref:transcription elongation factor GreB n=1 Tax=Niveibacterium sp. SC-1 TaxID=3135646 RepID=UPI00311DBEEE
MNKAFVKESEQDDEEPAGGAPALPAGSPNYMTRRGANALREELDALVRTERPSVVQIVSWAASNGDRSENGDYIYGKKRLREIDRRIRFLIKRLESATVVDPGQQEQTDRVFFGARVLIADVESGEEQRFQIVGVDEANASAGRVSWIAPIARALLKAREGESVRFMSPAGWREVEVLEIHYED